MSAIGQERTFASALPIPILGLLKLPPRRWHANELDGVHCSSAPDPDRDLFGQLTGSMYEKPVLGLRIRLKVPHSPYVGDAWQKDRVKELEENLILGRLNSRRCGLGLPQLGVHMPAANEQRLDWHKGIAVENAAIKCPGLPVPIAGKQLRQAARR